METEVYGFLEQVLLLGTGLQVVGSGVPFGDSIICFRVHQGKKTSWTCQPELNQIFENYLIFIIYSERQMFLYYWYAIAKKKKN